MLLRLFMLVSLVLSTIGSLLLGGFEGYGWLWMLPLMTLGFLLVFLLLAFGFLLIMCKRVDLDKEQEQDDPVYRKITEVYLESILPALRINIKTKGMNKVPPEGRFMLVCNHCHLADPTILLHCFAGHQLAFISKQENRDMFVIGKVMHKLLCQLLNRENDREALRTIIKCIQILKEDKASVAVFPEGGIDKQTHKLHHFRPGVFKIAQKANVPIVVCTLTNTKDVLHNMVRLKRTDVTMTLIDVIPPEELKGVATTQIAQRVYEMMAENLGPENVAEENT